jgi:hypothetical protein
MSCGARAVASSSFLPYYLRHKLVSTTICILESVITHNPAGLAIALEAVCFSDIFPGRGPLHISRPSNVATLAAYLILTALINLYCTTVISWTGL